MSTIDGANGYSQPPKVHYSPPPRQKDDDSARFQAQQKTQTEHPAVKVTLSPDAQRALAAQKNA